MRSTGLRALLLLLLTLLLASAPSQMAAAPGSRLPALAATTTSGVTARTTRELSATPLVSSCVVNPAQELVITAPQVVDDCIRTGWGGVCPLQAGLTANRGAWTFGHLMEGVFGTTDANILSNGVLGMLQTWLTNQTINGDVVPARPAMESFLIQPWLTASGGTTLDMKIAPMRLLAIVFRPDLRNPPGSPFGSTGGEGRFVYGVYNINDPQGPPPPFTIIVEFGLDAQTCSEIQNWGTQFHNLGNFALGSSAYNSALEVITDQFTAINASPAKTNGSALNQLRTNEIQLSSPWQLREFRLPPAVAGSTGNPLLPSTVALTPNFLLQAHQSIADFANGNAAAILSNDFFMPPTFEGNFFLGGAAPNQLTLGWDGPPPACTSITNPNVRLHLSLNTCQGCHGAETGTTFLQVAPRPSGSASQLSAFLTPGITVTDPVCTTLTHRFNEFERRSADLCDLLGSSCSQINAEQPVSFTH